MAPKLELSISPVDSKILESAFSPVQPPANLRPGSPVASSSRLSNITASTPPDIQVNDYAHKSTINVAAQADFEASINALSGTELKMQDPVTFPDTTGQTWQDFQPSMPEKIDIVGNNLNALRGLPSQVHQLATDSASNKVSVDNLHGQISKHTDLISSFGNSIENVMTVVAALATRLDVEVAIQSALPDSPPSDTTRRLRVQVVSRDLRVEIKQRTFELVFGGANLEMRVDPMDDEIIEWYNELGNGMAGQEAEEFGQLSELQIDMLYFEMGKEVFKEEARLAKQKVEMAGGRSPGGITPKASRLAGHGRSASRSTIRGEEFFAPAISKSRTRMGSGSSSWEHREQTPGDMVVSEKDNGRPKSVLFRQA